MTNTNFVELWVAATDMDFSISRKGYHILMAAYALMENTGDSMKISSYFEFFAYLSQVFENVCEYATFFSQVENDFMKHQLYELVSNVYPCPSDLKNDD